LHFLVSWASGSILFDPESATDAHTIIFFPTLSLSLPHIGGGGASGEAKVSVG
jgi:hypothetical protein